MSNAKEASEAEHLGNALLQLCRKKAPEKDLLQVLEVRRVLFTLFEMCARSQTHTFAAVLLVRLSFSLSLSLFWERLLYSSAAAIRFLFLRVVFR